MLLINFFLLLLGTSFQPKAGFVILDKIENELYISIDTTSINGFLLEWNMDSEGYSLDIESFEFKNLYPAVLFYSIGGYANDLNKENFILEDLNKYKVQGSKNRIKVFHRASISSNYELLATLDLFNDVKENTQVGCACFGVVKYLEYYFKTSIESNVKRVVACLNIKIPTKTGVANIMISRIFFNESPAEFINWGEEMIGRIHIE